MHSSMRPARLHTQLMVPHASQAASAAAWAAASSLPPQTSNYQLLSALIQSSHVTSNHVIQPHTLRASCSLTLLQLAVLSRQPHLVCVLLQHGADIHSLVRPSHTAYHLGFSADKSQVSASNDPTLFCQMMQYELVRSAWGVRCTAFDLAIKLNEIPCLKLLLTHMKQSSVSGLCFTEVNAASGSLLLTQACECGHLEAICSLTQHGAADIYNEHFGQALKEALDLRSPFTSEDARASALDQLLNTPAGHVFKSVRTSSFADVLEYALLCSWPALRVAVAHSGQACLLAGGSRVFGVCAGHGHGVLLYLDRGVCCRCW